MILRIAMLDWPFDWYPDVLRGDEEDIEKQAKSKIYILEQDINELGETIDQKREKYRAYIKRGAEEPEARRKIFAMRARTEKFKAHFHRLKRKKKMIDLMKWTMKLGEAELQELQQEIDDMTGAGAILDWDTDAMQQKMREMEADLQAEMSELENMMGGMTVSDASPASIDVGNLQEEKLMEQFAQDEIAGEDIDITEPDQEDEDVTSEPRGINEEMSDLGVEDL